MNNKKMIPLDISMISIADTLLNDIEPSQVPIAKFDDLKVKIPFKGIIDEFNAPEITMLCTHLIDKANTYQAVCGALHLEAKRRHQAAYAKAFRITCKDALEDEGNSVTDKTRKSFADMDDDVLKYLRLMNAWGTMSAYFQNLRDDMTNRFYFFKKVFEYKNKITPDNLS